MTENKTLLLLPRWFIKRQLIVSTCLFVIFPFAMIFPTKPMHIVLSLNSLGMMMVLIGMALLYPYSRYAVQWVIDYWHGNERIVYDCSVKSSLDRKFMKLMASLILLMVLGPLCLLVLLMSRWRQRRVQV